MAPPIIPPPYVGPLKDLRGTVVTCRVLTCADCGTDLEVAVVMTDDGAIALMTEHEGDVDRRH